MKKRILALLLALVMLAPAASSCSNQSAEDTPKDPAETAADPGSAEIPELKDEKEMEVGDIIAQRSQIPDNLPAMDFGGADFRFLSQEDHAEEFYVEEVNGEATNDAIFNRNKLVEERFNCHITNDSPAANDTEPVLTKLVTAGSDEYELVDQCQYKAYRAISKKDYLNWLDIPYIDGEMPWWNTVSNNNATINGKLFCITGDLCISGLLWTYCMYFNQTLLENHGYSVEGMYDTVREGKWTIDTLRSMAETIFEDKDGDGKAGPGDVLGFSHFDAEGCDAWIDAAGEHITQFVDGQFVITMDNERVYDLLVKVVDLVYNTPGCYHYSGMENLFAQFVAGNVAFMPTVFKYNFSYFRDVTDPYGMLPFPKYDEAQDAYYSMAQDQFAVLGIPITLPQDRYDFVGVVTEALCAESYKTVYPVFFNVALKNKYSEDPSTAEMIDLIVESRQDEFVFQFGESLSRLPYWFRDLMNAQSTDMASQIKKSQKAVKKALEKIYGYYE